MHSVQKKITSNCKRVAASALLFFVSSIAFAQSQVTGTVKDVNGEPLIGVSVVEEGTTNGTVTDMEGKYTLNVKPGAKLKISYIGFTTQEIKAVTSSITTIKSEDLNKGVFSDPAQMLQGKVPGLIVTSNGDPNGSPAISLRGASSLRGGEAMSPYYVIDGIPGVDISMVAPDDIESIDVLRDATATAIYGSKAANGVIIITTKKGAAGHTNVTYNGYVGFDRIAKTLDMMSASEMKAFASETGTAIDDNGGDVDWQKEVLRTGVSYNHNVSINGGNDKTKYMASVNYQKRNGIIKGSDMSRMNVRSLLSTT